MKLSSLLLSIWLACALAFAGDVQLAWDPNSETDLAGYKVYWGTASRTYGAPVTLTLEQSGHPSPTYTVTGLAAGTYYFAVTAYNTSALESGYSNEVSTTVAGEITGDLNGDGQVNIVDAQLLVNMVLGVGTQNSKADLNKDSQINILDLQALINIILRR